MHSHDEQQTETTEANRPIEANKPYGCFKIWLQTEEYDKDKIYLYGNFNWHKIWQNWRLADIPNYWFVPDMPRQTHKEIVNASLFCGIIFQEG